MKRPHSVFLPAFCQLHMFHLIFTDWGTSLAYILILFFFLLLLIFIALRLSARVLFGKNNIVLWLIAPWKFHRGKFQFCKIKIYRYLQQTVMISKETLHC